MRLLDHTADLSHQMPRAAAVLAAAALVHAAAVTAYSNKPLAEASATVERLATAGTWKPVAVQPVLDILERETRGFLDMPAGKEAARVGDRLVRILGSLHHGLTEHLAAMRQAVFERDADIETLLAAKPYHERNTLALTTLYNLSWARYRLAQLTATDAEKRQRLIADAIRGFTEFLYVNEVPEVYGNCLYGRALSFYALGERRNAIDDLQAAVDLGRRNPIYEQAQAALAAVRSGKPVRGSAPVDPTAAELDRLTTLLRSVATASETTAAGASRGGPPPAAQTKALALARGLAARGQGMAVRVERVIRGAAAPTGAFVNFLLAELASDRGEHAAARERYAAVLTASDRDADLYRLRARLGVAEASYRMADYQGAMEALGALLQGQENVDAGTLEAAYYLRFKAIEAARASPEQTPGTAMKPSYSGDDSYLAALEDYLRQESDGPHAGEVRYRLAELFRARSDCAGVLRVLDTLKASNSWDQQALFMALQCHAESARAAWHAGAPEAEAQYSKALITARGITAGVSGSKDPKAVILGARAALLAALLAASAPTPRYDDVVALTRERAEAFQAPADLDADRIALRAIALAEVGRRADARAAMDHLMTLDVDAASRRNRLREVGSALMRAAERDDKQGRANLLPLVQKAYAELIHSGHNEPAGAASDGASAVADLAALGQVSLELGDLKEAAFAYESLLDRDPKSMEALRGVAQVAGAEGELDTARNRWRDLRSRATPGDTLWYESTVNMARIDERLGRRERACALLREADTGAFPSIGGALAAEWRETEERLCAETSKSQRGENVR